MSKPIVVEQQIGNVKPGSYSRTDVMLEHSFVERAVMEVEATQKKAQARSTYDRLEAKLTSLRQVEAALWNLIVESDSGAVFGSRGEVTPPDPSVIRCNVPDCPNEIADSRAGYATVGKCELHAPTFVEDYETVYTNEVREALNALERGEKGT